jgi:hypothetical protein
VDGAENLNAGETVRRGRSGSRPAAAGRDARAPRACRSLASVDRTNPALGVTKTIYIAPSA